MNKSMGLKCYQNGTSQKINGETLYFVNENQVTELSITFPSSVSGFAKSALIEINGSLGDILLGFTDTVKIPLTASYFPSGGYLYIQPYAIGGNEEREYWDKTSFEIKTNLDGGILPTPPDDIIASIEAQLVLLNAEIQTKIPKVPSATIGNFSTFTEDGSVEDSGKKNSDFVHVIGDETIGGTKTFAIIPVLPNADPTTDNQAARKKFVTDGLNGKEPTLTKGDLSSTTEGISISGGNSSVIGSGTTITIDKATQLTDGLQSSEDKTKLDGITANATKTENSVTNGNIKINGTETTVYALPNNVTTKGNTFNGNSQLVETTTDGKLPIIDGSNITNVSGTDNTKVVANAPITGATKTKITYDTKGLVTSGDNATLDDIGDGSTRKLSDYIPTSEKSQALGVATLDDNVKIPLAQIPDSLVGSLNYHGVWDASTGVYPTLVGGLNKGDYWIISVAGIIETVSYAVKDWLIYNGTTWDKIDNTQDVSSVFGRVGNVVANSGDYDADKITETATRVFVTPSEKTAITHSNRTALDNVSGVNTGDESEATIKTKLGITTLSGSNTGDQVNITGNAGTATKLETARKINGVDFDGTADITVADSTKVVANTAITGATKTKITYDTKGLVTSGADATLDDIGDGSTRKLSNYIAKTTNVTSIDDTGIADGEIAVFDLTNKKIKTSDKTISTTLDSTGNTIPTGKAITDKYNVASGIAGLDANSRIAVAQLPNNLISSTTYESAWKSGTLSVSGSVFTLTGHGFTSGDPVEFRANTGVLPTGVLAFDSDNIGGTYYNATILDANTFEIYSHVGRISGIAISAFIDYNGTVAGTTRATATAHGLGANGTSHLLVSITGTTNYNGTYTVTVIDANSFYFTKAFVSTETGTMTTKVTPSDTGTSGYQVRLAGLSSFTITGLDLAIDKRYDVEIADFGFAKVSTSSRGANIRINNTTSYPFIGYQNSTTYTSNTCPIIISTAKKYSIAKSKIELTYFSDSTIGVQNYFNGSNSDDKNLSNVAYSLNSGGMFKNVGANLTSLTVTAEATTILLIRNGVKVIVRRIN